MKTFVTAFLLSASTFQPLVSHASGQSLIFQVKDAESGQPIAGAFVSLLGQDGRILRNALTGQSAGFSSLSLLKAPSR